MKRHLFLSGPAFSGKSRLIREQLGSGLQNAGGFCTELCKAPDGSVLGCAMIPAASAGGVQGLERELFLGSGIEDIDSIGTVLFLDGADMELGIRTLRNT